MHQSKQPLDLDAQDAEFRRLARRGVTSLVKSGRTGDTKVTYARPQLGQQPRQGRAGRVATNTRTRGSRRVTSTSSSSSGDDPGEPPAPAERGRHLLFLACPRYGRVNRALARFLRGVAT
jgi:hypothetical protein